MTEELTKARDSGEFGEIFAVLAIQLRWQDADEGSMQSYFDALKDISDALLKRSAHQLANEPGRRFFPTTGEWREAALRLEADDRRRVMSGVRDWKIECTACDDSGWEYHHCEGDKTCGRQHEHRPHNFVTVCPCRDTNRTYQRHHASEPTRGRADNS